MVTITGGKWTTYRRMGADAVDTAIEAAGLVRKPSATDHLQLTGNPHDAPTEPQTAASVTDEFIHKAIHEEQAKTIDDILSRRCRLLLLDALAAIEVAPRVAAQLGRELNLSEEKVKQETERFIEFAKQHLPQR